ncbi:hypothetical protein [Embleya sp. NBC_00896]|uniref:hypothetical protein n=1 Tax=Embleya sp. NBC_00896 TaxID=2975961 RepID=UPI0038688C9A|nr:hypothetical protein OG928_17665 [Embleya sp. NBC_00896]
MTAVNAQPPIVGGALWTAVMTREASTCGCTGECGKRHADGGGRCNRHDGLIVAPRDLAVPLAVAVALCAADLTTWCDRCHKPAKSAATKAAAAAGVERFESDSLF